MIRKLEDGTELDVFTAEEMAVEVASKVAEEVGKKEGEFTKTKAEIEAERDEARKALGDRTGEFKNFREIHADALAKLSIAERTIYENQKFQEDDRVRREEEAKTNLEKSVESAIKARVGTDQKIIDKVKDVYKLIGLDAKTPEEINQKIMMAVGAIGTTEPNLIASIGGFSGGHFPPSTKTGEETKNYADTPEGKQAAGFLGLTTEAPKQQ